MSEKTEVIDKKDIVIRFSGDSGDGMQLTGQQFSDAAALFGNGVSTFPDYPAEIRAPQGTVGGVSGFQVHIGNDPIKTPGDFADVLVAMNPAALKANLRWAKKGATIIVNLDAFTDKNIEKAGYKENPLEDAVLQDYNVVPVKITTLTEEALKDSGLDQKSIVKCKNMFALGMIYWMFDRTVDHTRDFINQKFAKKPEIASANVKVLESGFNYASNVHALAVHFNVAPAQIEKGRYRTITGNKATAWGFLAAAEKANLPLFCGSYPITPATDILQELALRRDLGVKTYQAEDEIAGICTSIGASYVGNLAITTTSGPGLALKSEAAGLAVMAELPLVIVDVQRGGPSTGLPTKTEQSDLLQALYGRNGESPMPVIAATSPTNCFDAAYMACKIALEHMTPVVLLTDAYIANGSAAWRLPDLNTYPSICPPYVKLEVADSWTPFQRDPQTGVRYWATPGTPGFMHRIGGLEKSNETGAISTEPENHFLMTKLRAEKVEKIADSLPPLTVEGDPDADLLIVGFGGTYGHLHSAMDQLNAMGKKAALAHFRVINPLPKNTAEVLRKYKTIVVAEQNMGQLAGYLRMKVEGIHLHQFNQVKGQPFVVKELVEAFSQLF